MIIKLLPDSFTKINQLTQWSWAVVQREISYMAYDLHPVKISYSVSMESKKLKCFNEPFFRNVDLKFWVKKSKIDIK